ncbi:hypothetical protein GGTG_01333 [Gaeumannomyces tritici R3-111a-1]|uniref:Uncharacterized protein n=1 Tax=Gaeumannomyces tritici (strain R3-111a-1) TaxID=644352 RepID=J3NJ99_GAET3|nr:hypothetical protein GGTG_01333 [Gaeumannomyces tritici R3-111a-1]EJT81350.1 hypothetical protein GGTG_01333 [Gaeumannomyces tritici R3-111a-1]
MRGSDARESGYRVPVTHALWPDPKPKPLGKGGCGVSPAWWCEPGCLGTARTSGEGPVMRAMPTMPAAATNKKALLGAGFGALGCHSAAMQVWRPEEHRSRRGNLGLHCARPQRVGTVVRRSASASVQRQCTRPDREGGRY